MKLSAVHTYEHETSYFFTFPTTCLYQAVISHIEEFPGVLGEQVCERMLKAVSEMEISRHSLHIPNTELR